MNKYYYKAILKIINKGHQLTDIVAIELKQYEISEPQFNVLRILRGANGNPLCVQEIAKRMVHRSSNVTRIIDKLLKRDLVIRQECSGNRRKMDILITNNGLALLKKLDIKLENFHNQYKNNLTNEEFNHEHGISTAMAIYIPSGRHNGQLTHCGILRQRQWDSHCCNAGNRGTHTSAPILINEELLPWQTQRPWQSGQSG